MTIDPKTKPYSPKEDSWVWNVENFARPQVPDRVEVDMNSTNSQRSDLENSPHGPYASVIVICSSVFGAVTAIIYFLIVGGVVASFVVYLFSTIGLAIAWIVTLFIVSLFPR